MRRGNNQSLEKWAARGALCLIVVCWGLRLAAQSSANGTGTARSNPVLYLYPDIPAAILAPTPTPTPSNSVTPVPIGVLPYAAVNLTPPGGPIGTVSYTEIIPSDDGSGGSTSQTISFIPNLVPKKVTTSGNILLLYDNGVSGMPSGYSWLAGSFFSIDRAPSWLVGNPNYSSTSSWSSVGAVTPADMNDSGVVVGNGGAFYPVSQTTEAGFLGPLSPFGGEDGGAIYWTPATGSTTMSANLFASDTPGATLGVGAITNNGVFQSQSISEPEITTVKLIDNNGAVYGTKTGPTAWSSTATFEDGGSGGFGGWVYGYTPSGPGWIQGVSNGGGVKWSSYNDSNPIYYSLLQSPTGAVVPFAVSPGGGHMLQQYQGSFYLDGQAIPFSLGSSPTIFSGINEAGRYLVNINSSGSGLAQGPSFADGLNAPQLISTSLGSGSGMAINNNNDILATNGSGPTYIYTWQPPTTATDNQSATPGSYSQNPVVINTPSGWTVGSVIPSIGDSRVLAGTIISQGTSAPAAFFPCALLADSNGDGVIDGNDINANSASTPFRLWLNDDDDNGNPLVPDYETGVVNGQDDLKDFYPIALMIQNLVSVLPSGQYSYVLKQADNALNFTYTNLTADNAFDYLTSQTPSGYGTALSQAAANATVTPITASGVTLDSSFIQQITARGGVILVEGCAGTNKPLVLEVHDSNGNAVLAVNLYLITAKITRDDADQFADNGLGVLLEDWPETKNTLRSPKFLFAQQDNIYVEYAGPEGLGNNSVQVTVTSESDVNGITFALSETSPGVYTNQAPTHPLRLGTSTGLNADCYTIKTLNKEVLKFTLAVGGQQINLANVMVDRAKFASCGINKFYGSSTGDQATVRSEAITNGYFFDAGDGPYDNNVVAEGNPMKTFIKNAGANQPLNGQASFLWISSHGMPNGDLCDDDPNGLYIYPGQTVTIGPDTFTNGEGFIGNRILSATDINNSTDWNQDVEWVVLASCLQLNQNGGGYAAWQQAMNGSPRPIHGILGAFKPTSGDLRTNITDFWANMRVGQEYVVDAYSDAMELTSSPQPWAMAVNANDIYDRVKEVGPDGVLRIAETDTPIGYLDVDVLNGRVEISDQPVRQTFDGGNGLLRVDLPVAKNLLLRRTVSMRDSADFSKSKVFAFARRVSKSADGKQNFVGRNLSDSLNARTSLTKDQAGKAATLYLNKEFKEIASRISLKEVDERSSGLLNHGGSKQTARNGFLVQFNIDTNNIPVWGSYANVVIRGDKIEGISVRSYDEVPDGKGASATPDTVQPLAAQDAVTRNLPMVKGSLGIGGKYEVLMVNLCYVDATVASSGLVGNNRNFVLAWHFVVNTRYKGLGSKRRLVHVWLDATTGNILGQRQY